MSIPSVLFQIQPLNKRDMNLYWPTYKNLEAEIAKLTYFIYINDSQLNVYSSVISDLMLRASAEIESISKELYKRNGGSKIDKIKYDTDALEYLNKLWLLDEKIVSISSINCYQTVKNLRPFTKNEVSTFHGKNTFSWNNAYQNLKHDRVNSISFGSVKYLFDIMAALFLLNIYFKNESYPLGNDGRAINFPVNMGSELFSVKVNIYKGLDSEFNYLKLKDADECVYSVKAVDGFIERYKKTSEESNVKLIESVIQHPKIQAYFKENDVRYDKIQEICLAVLGIDETSRILNAAHKELVVLLAKCQYEAVLSNRVTYSRGPTC